MTSRIPLPDDGREPQPQNGEQLSAKALARARREAMHRRARRIRRRVAAGAAALFAAAFLGVYVQLAAGHDPALNAAAKRRRRQPRPRRSAASESSAARKQAEATSEGSSSSSETTAGSESSGSTEALGIRRILGLGRSIGLKRILGLERRIVILLGRSGIELAVLRHDLAVMSARETIERFDCFGGSCGVCVAGDGPGESAAERRPARPRRGCWSGTSSSRGSCPTASCPVLNGDPRERVPVSPLMAYLAAIARHAGELTGGLVDATLLAELHDAGYDRALPPRAAARAGPGARPAAPRRRRLARASLARARCGRRRAARCCGRRAFRSTAEASPRACSPTFSPRRSRNTRASPSTAAAISRSAAAPA